MADHLLDDPDTKDSLDNQDDPLTADLNDQEDDNSLLDAGLQLPELHDDEEPGDHDDLLAPTPTDEGGEHLLDNTADDDQVSQLRT